MLKQLHSLLFSSVALAFVVAGGCGGSTEPEVIEPNAEFTQQLEESEAQYQAEMEQMAKEQAGN